MNAYFAMCLAILSIGSCVACYYIGRDSMRQKIKDSQRRKLWWEEFDDQD